MTTKAELLALADRVEAGSGRDMPLHLEIADVVWPVPDTGHFLTSIDAVEALRKQLLPGSRIEVQGRDQFVAWVTNDINPQAFAYERGEAPTESRARLAALLRAYAGGLQG